MQGGVAMRKGPWMAEEDEILLEYVRRHGPRDWSSIRSKGLLPRTGKSCRLRWVNKLQPNLKTGCKFLPEEERIVIELQARFGNKWARIATYLPGRTDNDVKNFWSTRQKKLARILQIPLPSNSNKNQGKMPVSNEERPTFEVASLDLIPFGDEESCSGRCSRTSYDDNRDATATMNQAGLGNTHDHLTLPLLEPTPLDWEPLQLPFEHIPNRVALDFPLMFDSPELNIPAGLGDMNFQDKLFAYQDTSNLTQFPEGLPLFELGISKQTVKREEEHPGTTPDSFFDDLPMDMFDNLELLQQELLQPASSAAW